MVTSLLYSFTGLVLFAFGLFALIACAHPLRKILGVNVMATGIFLFLVATSYRAGQTIDPVPQAMVLTGIVVSVSTTAVALILAARIQQIAGGRAKPGRNRDSRAAGEQ
jgi:multicomponent Na+:H+ antiporter subunit C